MKFKIYILVFLFYTNIYPQDIEVNNLPNNLIKVNYGENLSIISKSEFNKRYSGSYIKIIKNDGTYIFSKNGKFLRKSKYFHYNFPLNERDQTSNSLIPACKRLIGSKCGYIDNQDNIIVPMIYESTNYFINNLAILRHNGKDGVKEGLINSKGEFLLDFKCDKVVYLSENLFFCGKKNNNINFKYNYKMYINKKESDKIFEDVRHCSEDLCPVKENGKWGYLNKNGNYEFKINLDIVEYIYSDTYISFSGEFAKFQLKEDNKFVILNKKGEILSKNTFIYFDDFSEELACACVDNNKCGFIDRNFNFAIKPIYGACKKFSEDYAAVVVNNEIKYWKYINKSGEDVLPASFLAAFEFNDGVAQVWFGFDPWDHVKAYINKRGKILHSEHQKIKD